MSSQSKSCRISRCSCFKIYKSIKSQFCTRHGIPVAMPCVIVWLDRNIRIMIKTNKSFSKFHFWAHTPLWLIEAEWRIYVSWNWVSIDSDNGLSLIRRQAIIWFKEDLLLIGPLGTNFSEIWIKIQIFPLKKMHLKRSSAKCRPFCHGLNL